jgi:hypothetical protein
MCFRKEIPFMKNKNQKFQSLLTTLVLTLILSGGLTLPGIVSGRPGPIPKEPPVEGEGPEDEEGGGIQPLSDLTPPITKIDK